MNASAIRVIKFGGSLFDSEHVIQQLPDWLMRQEPMVNLLVVGGGAIADAVRQFDAKYPLDEATAHHLCLDAMSITARLIANALSCAELLLEISNLEPQISIRELNLETALAPTDKLHVVDVRDFLNRRHDEPVVAELPSSWDVTSDSLAGVVAVSVGATELVLLKSCLPSMAAGSAPLSDPGYVDRYFAKLHSRLPRVRFVNARAGYTES